MKKCRTIFFDRRAMSIDPVDILNNMLSWTYIVFKYYQMETILGKVIYILLFVNFVHLWNC